MNIFILDYDIRENAKAHCDKHVVKMILESAQMLCGFHEAMGNPQQYKLGLAHMKHPCSIWVRDSLDNYDYLYELALELGDQYTERYGKIHNSMSVIENLPYTKDYVRKGLTTFARAFRKDMPQRAELLAEPDVVEAYRKYYIYDKARFAKWKTGNVPIWFNV